MLFIFSFFFLSLYIYIPYSTESALFQCLFFVYFSTFRSVCVYKITVVLDLRGRTGVLNGIKDGFKVKPCLRASMHLKYPVIINVIHYTCAFPALSVCFGKKPVNRIMMMPL